MKKAGKKLKGVRKGEKDLEWKERGAYLCSPPEKNGQRSLRGKRTGSVKAEKKKGIRFER